MRSIALKAKAILDNYVPHVENRGEIVDKIIERIKSADLSPMRNFVKYDRRKISQLQNNIIDSLKELNKSFSGENKMCNDHGDSADIYGEIGDYCVIVEIDATRADQIAKKLVSRTALILEKKIIYIALCYPRGGKNALQEVKKYFVYCRSILLNIDSTSSFTGLLIQGEKSKRFYKKITYAKLQIYT